MVNIHWHAAEFLVGRALQQYGQKQSNHSYGIQKQSNHSYGIPSRSRREKYCRLVEYSCDRSPAVIATDVSVVNLDNHTSL